MDTRHCVVMAVEVELHESRCEYNVSSVQKGEEDYESADDLHARVGKLPKGRALLVWNAEEDAPTGDPDELVAFTQGSFWLCPRCVDRSDTDVHPAKRSHLVPGVRYRCDDCLAKIR